MKSALSSQIIDHNAEFRGVSVTKLMNRAGKEACRAILQKWKKPRKVQIFCGGGNNGGDSFALAAEFLAKKIEVEVILAVAKSRIRTKAARHHCAKLSAKVISIFSVKTKFDGDILVDALLGIGAVGGLQKPLNVIVQKLMKAKGNLVSLDVATSSKLKPKLVVAFHASKNSKNEIVVPIGIPKIAETHFGPGDVKFYFPRRKLDSHKGKNGRVVIIGGSAEFVGAPLFAGLGAAAIGVDLVEIFVPAVNFSAARKFSPNFLVRKFLGNSGFLTLTAAAKILEFASKNKATLVVGPGLGKQKETIAAIEFLARNCRQPLVFDADALIPNLPKFVSKKVVLTPHGGELKRLLEHTSPSSTTSSATNCRGLSKKLNSVILEKGKVDTIHSSTQTRWNDQGNPILTVGGTGDVLAGIVGGLLAREVEPFEAAGIAAFLVGLAGKKIAVKSESTTPQLLAREIPKVVRKILDKRF
ncbi:NAD(P)H-hydrate dehydratase [Candidatus Gracilibacteria bacterium]|nr:NAD(P)H-hydrate dehydratase [Candidatus Gracilibacteria bacterium]MCF7856215.1 NAD(P)H-hydrate dehydratase [Candidatus Gracilibacteria bacterium]MCF7896487.1 NAD(P)H-hydrate dehydratase [Candidatus Gracilibacteria bacterium]